MRRIFGSCGYKIKLLYHTYTLQCIRNEYNIRQYTMLMTFNLQPHALQIRHSRAAEGAEIEDS